MICDCRIFHKSSIILPLAAQKERATNSAALYTLDVLVKFLTKERHNAIALDRPKFGSGSARVFWYLDQLSALDQVFDFVGFATKHVSGFDQGDAVLFCTLENVINRFRADDVVM